MTYYKLFLLALVFVISGCATPLEVKQLSLKQLDYLTVLTDAVTIQSEGLVLIAEKLKQQSEGNMSCHQQNSIDRLNQLMTTTVDLTDMSERRALKQKILAQATEINKVTAASRQKLALDFKAIKIKTQQLQVYLKKIKEVQVVLNGYIQSQKAGEQLLSSSVGHTSVDGFLGTINTYIPLIKLASGELAHLLQVKQ
ncbi:MAG: hypothetical protein KAG10_02515 [Methylococcales bacterium]|nr:hypothetical protein [Methylococcales bacterium]